MDLSIIIPNYNCSHYLKKCLESIVNTIENISYEIIVVDNASTDSSIKVLKELSTRVANLKVIQNKKNYYFAKANNQGFKASSGKFIMSLNSDTVVTKGTLEKLIDFLEKDPNVGIVAPKALNPDGSIQRFYRRFPNIWNTFIHYSILGRIFNKFFLANRPRAKFLYLDNDFSTVEEVDQAGAVCILIRRSLIEKMGVFFDEGFPLLFNDVDLSKRVSDMGLKRCVLPEATIIHFGSMSSKLLPKNVYEENLLVGVYSYFRKHHRKSSWLLFFFKPLLIKLFFQRKLHSQIK